MDERHISRSACYLVRLATWFSVDKAGCKFRVYKPLNVEVTNHRWTLSMWPSVLKSFLPKSGSNESHATNQ